MSACCVYATCSRCGVVCLRSYGHFCGLYLQDLVPEWTCLERRSCPCSHVLSAVVLPAESPAMVWKQRKEPPRRHVETRMRNKSCRDSDIFQRFGGGGLWPSLVKQTSSCKVQHCRTSTSACTHGMFAPNTEGTCTTSHDYTPINLLLHSLHKFTICELDARTQGYRGLESAAVVVTFPASYFDSQLPFRHFAMYCTIYSTRGE